jgi:hypothetical protein
MEWLQILPGIDEVEQFLGDALSSTPQLGVLVLLAVLLVFTLAAKGLGAWAASLFLILVGVSLVLFPEAASLSAAAAAGIGSAAIVAASRSRARIVRRLEDLQERLHAVAVEQERRKLRELRSDRTAPGEKASSSTGQSAVQETAAPVRPREAAADAELVEPSLPNAAGQGARHSE